MSAQDAGGGPGERSASLSALFAPMPSLDWTLAKLTGQWAPNGEMISCPLPGHDDSTPSFNLWGEDEEGVPQRFGCFGCGRGGDVLELITILSEPGVDPAKRAALLAEEEAEDKTPRQRTPRKPAPSRDLDQLLREMNEGLNSRRAQVFQNYMTSKGLDSEDLETFAQDVWEWTVSEKSSIAVPHRDREGRLTGIKYRSSDKKLSEPGSRFPHLYGAWRDQGRPQVVLCEGESDALWASWALRSEEIDVLALPAGAQQAVQEDWVEEVKDRELILAFDSDSAGMEAAKRWLLVRPDALLARLPEDEDLLSCGIPVRELLERARAPRRATGSITVVDDVFAKVTKDGVAPVSDFAIIPERELFTDDGPAWEGP